MRVLNRPLALLVAAALGAVGVFVVIEVIAHATGHRPVVFDWPAWYRWGERTQWNRVVVKVWSVVLLVAGLLLLLIELRPHRSSRLGLRSDDDGTDAALSRRGLAGSVRAAAEQVDGISTASVTAGRRVSVVATTAGVDQSAARELTEPVERAVAQAVERLGLTRAPRTSVRVRPGKD